MSEAARRNQLSTPEVFAPYTSLLFVGQQANTTRARLPQEEGDRYARKVTFGEQEPPQRPKERSSKFLNSIRGKGKRLWQSVNTTTMILFLYGLFG